MRYEGSVYRPPSEAYSLIVQATIGCSHNKCSFCSMYKDKKFRIREISGIIEDLEEARGHYSRVEKIFLADGNALALKTKDLAIILKKIKDLFPECQRIGTYGTPKDILRKSEEELKELYDLGLSIIYLGVESGNDKVLKRIKKGVTAEEIIKAGRKIMQSGMKLSVTLISGLGGKENWREHAQSSAKVVNAINPDYLALLTLLIQPGTEIYEEIECGKFQLLTAKEVMQETEILVKNLAVDQCIFRSNHASNYIPLAGTLPQDQEEILSIIKETIEKEGDNLYKQETFRSL